jgi:TPR repeat protein
LPVRCKLPVECRELGLGLSGPAASDADLARAFDYFQSGCALQDAASCAAAAAALDFGRGVARDRKRALAAYEKSCALKDQRACTAAAMFHALGVEGAAKKDLAKGRALLARACAAGEGGACLNLAERHASGTGAPRDAQKAAELRRRALELAGD